MGYQHITNLYKNTEILLFKECYALEKIHGTSAHVRWNPEGEGLGFKSGGSKHEEFTKIFDEKRLKKELEEQFPNSKVVIFGEAYGGNIHGMKETYGDKLKFIAFEVKIDDNWLDVPNAEDVTKKLGLEFVDYKKIPAELEAIDKERARPSAQAIMNGMGDDKEREGVVLRPLIEVKKNNGERILVKHKNNNFIETKTPREVDPEKIKKIREAEEIATEWVTEMRLNHVLDKLENPTTIAETGKVVKAMIEDVYREAKGEIEESQEAKKAIGKRTSKLYQKRIRK